MYGQDEKRGKDRDEKIIGNTELDWFKITKMVILNQSIIVRAKPCLPLCSFSLIRKTELWETNKPPAVRVVEDASAYSIKPPVL